MRHLPQEIIRRKRDGARLDEAEIEAFIAGLTAGHVSEGQAAAFAMAVLFRGLSVEERVALTHAMARSGVVLTWDLPGPVLDKHSTGGVGDKASPALAPAVAACGVASFRWSRARPRAHGRHARQARRHPGLRSRPDLSLTSRTGGARGGVRSHRADGRRPRPPTGACTRSGT